MNIRSQVSEIQEVIIDSFLETNEKFQTFWFEDLTDDEVVEMFLNAAEKVLEMLDSDITEDSEDEELEDKDVE